ncbi:hypothetical protein MNBD_ALPHA07-1436 [hydrothermal vent metagenome]|uniref:Transglycosylase associated protein n=1 Tax=hydrothermal vent metagenome TaxID=652676 RepID=A0A3B0SCC8_9ZZZZ
MPILWLIIIGVAAGYLTTRMMKMETNIIVTIAIGIAGALVGGLVLGILLRVMGMMSGLIGAILGALLLIWLWQTYFKGGK